ncbi:contactin-2-like [Branchiostoma floridae]|uniref:Contactin-2-like n=1 Tax=Branchiostoma floridae TaxID=7739 RepID=A0A9J7LQ27_BRAFL|nr:contactin-2-like [Branchiostoma floridae]
MALAVLSVFLLVCATHVTVGQEIVKDDMLIEPEFQVVPQNTIFNADLGLNYTKFKCRAKGIPDPQYFWLQDGIELDLDTDPEKYTMSGGDLYIYSPTLGRDDSTYQCVAYNSAGAELSPGGILTFAFVKSFDKTARDPKNVDEGQGFSIACNPPDNYPGLTYTWYKDTPAQRVPPDERIFISYQTGDLFIKNAIAADSGDYYCLVQNSMIQVPNTGSIADRSSPPTTVKVRAGPPLDAAPTIVWGPKVVAVEGGEAFLECFDFSYPSSNQVWKRIDPGSNQEIPLPRKARYDSFGHVLLMLRVAPEDGGIYRCDADNRHGTSRTDIELEVKILPKLKPLPVIQPIVLGGSITWECVVLRGTPPLTFSWFADSDPLKTQPDNKYVVTGRTLTVNELDITDEGRYQCLAVNDYGVDHTSTLLELSYPKIRAKIATQLAPRGTDYEVYVRWECSPVPNVEWTNERGDVIATKDLTTGATVVKSSKYNVTDLGTLVINNVQDSDKGAYTFKMTNQYGQVSDTGMLKVVDPGRLSTSRAPGDISVNRGARGTLRCDGRVPAPLERVFVWTVNDRMINFDTQSDLYGRGGAGDLIIKNAVIQQSGRYTCSLETPAHRDSGQGGTVTVKAQSAAPVGVKIMSTDEISALVRWVPSKDNGASCAQYTVEAQSEWDKGLLAPDTRWQYQPPVWTEVWRGTPKQASGPDSYGGYSVNITSLYPNTEYSFRVMCANMFGISRPSVPSAVRTTLPSRPLTAPTNLGYQPGTVGNLILTWKPIPRPKWGSDNISYVLSVRPRDRGRVTRADPWTTVNFNNSNPKSYVYNRPRPNPNQRFDAKIYAFNEYGSGPEVTWSAYAPAGKPPAMLKPKCTATTNVSALFEFELPRNYPAGMVSYYGVLYWTGKDDRKKNETREKILLYDESYKRRRLYPDVHDQPPYVTPIKGKQSFALLQLKPSTLYNFKIYARSGPYMGTFSPGWFSCTTQRAKPIIRRYDWWLPTVFIVFIVFLILLLLLICCAFAYLYKNNLLFKKKKPEEIRLTEVDVMTKPHVDKLRYYSDTITRYINPHKVTDRLVAKEVLPVHMAGDVKRIRNPKFSTNHLLGILVNRPDATFFHFSNAVRPEHPWLSDLLEDAEPEMTLEHKEMLENYEIAMSPNTDPIPIIDHLVKTKYLNPSEEKEIKKMDTRADMHGQVLQLLQDRPDPAFHEFQQTLLGNNVPKEELVAAADVNMAMAAPVLAPAPPVMSPRSAFEELSGSTIEVDDGQPVIIEINGYATDVRWFYEDIPLQNSPDYQQTSEGDEMHSIFISSVTKVNEGCYTCVGNTEFGEVRCDIYISALSKATYARTNIAYDVDFEKLYPHKFV